MTTYNPSTGLLDIEETPFRIFQADDAVITNTILYRGIILDPSLQLTVADLSGVVDEELQQIAVLQSDLADVSGRVFDNTTTLEDVSGRVLINEGDILDISGRVSDNLQQIATISGDYVSKSDNSLFQTINSGLFSNKVLYGTGVAVLPTSGVPVFINTMADGVLTGRIASTDIYEASQTLWSHLTDICLNGLTTTASGIRFDDGVPTNTTQTLYYDEGIFGIGSGLKFGSLNISEYDTRISTNNANIATNAANISNNVAAIATNASDISTNVAAISTNTSDIATLDSDKYDKTGGTITGNVSVSKSTPRISLNNTSTSNTVYFEERGDGYCYFNNGGNDIISFSNNAFNLLASAGIYITSNLVFSGDVNDVTISKTGNSDKSLRLQAGDDNSATTDDFAIDLIVRDSSANTYTAMKVNGKSQQIEINRDLTLDDTRGVIFEGSTTPASITNKLYRSGSNLFWNGTQLDVSAGGSTPDISDLSGRVFELEEDVVDLSSVTLANASNISTLQSDVSDISSVTLANAANITTLQGDVIDVSGRVSDNLLLIEDISANKNRFAGTVRFQNDYASNDYGVVIAPVTGGGFGGTGEMGAIRHIDNNVLGTRYLRFFELAGPSNPERVQIDTNLYLQGDFSGNIISPVQTSLLTADADVDLKTFDLCCNNINLTGATIDASNELVVSMAEQFRVRDNTTGGNVFEVHHNNSSWDVQIKGTGRALGTNTVFRLVAPDGNNFVDFRIDNPDNFLIRQTGTFFQQIDTRTCWKLTNENVNNRAIGTLGSGIVWSSGSYCLLEGNNTNTAVVFDYDDGIFLRDPASAGFFVNNTYFASLKDTGSLITNATFNLVNTTINGGGSDALFINGFGFSAGYGIDMNSDAGTGSPGMVWIRFRESGTQYGTISWNGIGTNYNSSSDYRLKYDIENIPEQECLERMKKLRTRQYKWKSLPDEQPIERGFIAHELDEDDFGRCVAGKKDEVDKDGQPVYQAIDTKSMLADVCCVIKYLIKENENLSETNKQLKLKMSSLESKIEILTKALTKFNML